MRRGREWEEEARGGCCVGEEEEKKSYSISSLIQPFSRSDERARDT